MKIATLLTAATLACAALAHAARPDDVAARAADAADRHLRANARAYGVSAPGTDLKRSSVRTDERGTTHVRYAQYYNGVRVFEGDAIAHVDARGRVEVTNALRPHIQLDTTPAYSEQDAVTIAVKNVRPAGAYTARTALKILPRGAHSARTRLVWHVTLFVFNDVDEPAEWESFLDARTGEVALAWNGLAHESVAATARTMHAGDRPINADAAADGRYYLRDLQRSGNYTLDMNSANELGPVISSGTSAFGDGLHTDCNGNPNRATAGADAHAAMTATWDFLKATFGRNGLDGAGGQVHARVHYQSCYSNAYWTIACNCATFGDGGSSYLPLVSTDIVGHELGHGLMDHEADLTTRGESGALNESHADIIGAMVEFYVDSTADVPDWWQGERIIRTNYDAGGNYTQLSAGRYLDDPPKDGSSPACWSRNVKNLNIHHGAGPNNHMFYLLAAGGTSRCNGNVVAGIGRDKAIAIWYKAVADYMTSSADYAAARTACLNAAAALYGSGSPEYQAVNAAYAAVNVK